MASEKISKIAADFETQLSGAISIGATSFTIASATDNKGNLLSDGLYAFTIDRDNTSAKEYLIGQLTASTKTIASISSISPQGVLTANAQLAHRIGANVIISDHSILAAISRILQGIGKLDPAGPLEYDTAPTLSAATQLATKGYVDSVVTGGTINADRIILGSQTAGETVAAGNIVYFKSSDSRWWKADADLTATFSNVLLGVALGAGTAGNTISGGVQIYGKCDSFTGLTATATYYLSNTAGAVATNAGTYPVILGQAFSTTGIFFNPGPVGISTSAGAGDAGKLIKTNTSGFVDETFIPFDYAKTYVKKSGIASSTTTGTTTIAHGLGVVPTYVKIMVQWYGTEYNNSEIIVDSIGTYDGTNTKTIYRSVATLSGSGVGTYGNSTTYIYYVVDPVNTARIRKATISVDATNITLTWSTDDINTVGTDFIWEAEGYTI